MKPDLHWSVRHLHSLTDMSDSFIACILDKVGSIIDGTKLCGGRPELGRSRLDIHAATLCLRIEF